MSKYVIIALAIIAVVAALPAEPEQNEYGSQGAYGSQSHHGFVGGQGSHLNFDNKEHQGNYGQITYGAQAKKPSGGQ